MSGKGSFLSKVFYRVFIVIGLIASAIGGVLITAEALLGTCLVVVGIVTAIYAFVRSELDSARQATMIEALSRLLSVSGLGNTYLELARNQANSRNSQERIRHLVIKAIQLDPANIEAREYYCSLAILEICFRQYVAGELDGPDAKALAAVEEMARSGRECKTG